MPGQSAVAAMIHYDAGRPETADWFRRAAAQGHAPSQYNLGVILASGESPLLKSDYVESYKWFNLSAAQGHTRASEARNLHSQKMTLEDVEEAQRRSNSASTEK